MYCLSAKSPPSGGDFSLGFNALVLVYATGERFMVRVRDSYRAACELALNVGVDLTDG